MLSLVECFSSFLLGVGRQALHSPSPVASSATVASTSEGEGLHADPLLHILSEYICDVSVFFGGRGIAPQALLLSTAVATSEEEGLHFTPLPRIAGGYFGKGQGPPPHTSGVYFVFLAVDGELHLGGVNSAHYTGVLAYTNFESTSYSPVLVGFLGNQVDGEFPIPMSSPCHTREIPFVKLGELLPLESKDGRLKLCKLRPWVPVSQQDPWREVNCCYVSCGPSSCPPRGVTVSTLDSDSSDRSSTPREVSRTYVETCGLVVWWFRCRCILCLVPFWLKDAPTLFLSHPPSLILHHIHSYNFFSLQF